MNSREFFKKELHWRMQDARISQTELANAVGVSKATVNCWLKGKAFPRIDTIQRIADVLGCKTDDLLSENLYVQTFITNPNKHLLNKDAEELIELWNNASDTAKQAALAVLKAIDGKN